MARRALYEALGASYTNRTVGPTQLESDLYDSWVQQSEDLEVDVKDWLRGGTPMGIEEEMVPRGVFPVVDEKTLE